ncbi:transposase [Candidatus Wolfebacteria bacterium]|nr:transposase [Candidatus Wolfebacteria bacterium]
MNELFHVLSRGVDQKKIFVDNQDHFRFVHDLFEFNDQERVNTTFYRFNQSNDIASRKIERRPRKLLVDIHCFCLMPTHYHLLLTPRVENGVSKFMKKVNMGYAKYFNGKYQRKGPLFESRYKSILVRRESHFIHLPYYIHLNPLDLKYPEWRKRELKNHRKTIKFLDSYRWSSHLDYAGQKNFPSIINKNLLTKFFGDANEYSQSIKEWLRDLSLNDISEVTLE